MSKEVQLLFRFQNKQRKNNRIPSLAFCTSLPSSVPSSSPMKRATGDGNFYSVPQLSLKDGFGLQLIRNKQEVVVNPEKVLLPSS